MPLGFNALTPECPGLRDSDCCPARFRPLSWRSGRIPALPYPPPRCSQLISSIADLFCRYYGSELTSRHFLAWSIEKKVDLIHIQPGKPIQNAHVESFNGRLRDECLNASWFWNLFDARRKIEFWRNDYNRQRPHSSLGYRTPAEFARVIAPSPSIFFGSTPLDSPQGQALRAALPALTQAELRAQTFYQEGEAALLSGGELG